MNKEIFFVDDDKNLLHAMKLIMHKTPYSVKTFLDPLEMLGSIQQGWGGIIVTDINMPVINGFEVLKRDAEIALIKKHLLNASYDFSDLQQQVDIELKEIKRKITKQLELRNIIRIFLICYDTYI